MNQLTYNVQGLTTYVVVADRCDGPSSHTIVWCSDPMASHAEACDLARTLFKRDAGLRLIGQAVALWAGMAKLWKARCRRCSGNGVVGDKEKSPCQKCSGRGWLLDWKVSGHHVLIFGDQGAFLKARSFHTESEADAYADGVVDGAASTDHIGGVVVWPRGAGACWVTGPELEKAMLAIGATVNGT